MRTYVVTKGATTRDADNASGTLGEQRFQATELKGPHHYTITHELNDSTQDHDLNVQLMARAYVAACRVQDCWNICLGFEIPRMLR